MAPLRESLLCDSTYLLDSARLDDTTGALAVFFFCVCVCVCARVCLCVCVLFFFFCLGLWGLVVGVSGCSVQHSENLQIERTIEGFAAWENGVQECKDFRFRGFVRLESLA